MMKTNRCKTFTILSLLALAGAVPAQGQTYQALILHPSGHLHSYGLGIDSDRQVGFAWGPISGNQSHALMWASRQPSVVDLNPIGYTETRAQAVSLGRPAGWGTGPATGGQPRALLWNPLLWVGNTRVALSLHPAGWLSSQVTGACDYWQVGYGRPSAQSGLHALLWRGTAASAVDLHPAGFAWSRTQGVYGGRQVGWGSNGATVHALLWQGSAGSVLDLHDSRFDWTCATGIYLGRQVGYGGGTITSGTNHALFWSGSAPARDLHPAGFDWTEAYGIGEDRQVGAGAGAATGGQTHALLWQGSAGSVRDLHNELPPDYVASTATGVDPNGNVIGAAVNAYGESHAVFWQRIPVLASLAITPTVLWGGHQTATGTVTIDVPAPGWGAGVVLLSSSPVVSVPRLVMIPPGQRSATFTVPAFRVGTATTATITAAYPASEGVRKQVDLRVIP